MIYSLYKGVRIVYPARKYCRIMVTTVATGRCRGFMVKTRDAVKKGSRRAANDDDLSMEDVLKLVVTAIEDKKGEDPVVLDLTDQLDYIDHMVICTGHTELHTRAIADAVSNSLAGYDIISAGLNGYRHGDWILLDYDVLVVHIFTPAVREFYRLEELWASGQVVELN